jgi:hypothetical protein
MGDFSSWLQDNWYDLGTLLILLAFFMGSVWFARNILKTIAAFQEQIGALLRVTIGSSAAQPLKDVSAERALAEGISSWLEPAAISAQNPVVKESHRFGLAYPGLLAWLQAPMHTTSGNPLRRMVKWLQAPVGS